VTDFKEENKNSFIPNSIFLSPYSPNKIIKYINNLKDSPTFYEHNLSNKVLKMTAAHISLPLFLIYNLAISTGISHCFKKINYYSFV